MTMVEYPKKQMRHQHESVLFFVGSSFFLFPPFTWTIILTPILLVIMEQAPKLLH